MCHTAASEKCQIVHRTLKHSKISFDCFANNFPIWQEHVHKKSCTNQEETERNKQDVAKMQPISDVFALEQCNMRWNSGEFFIKISSDCSTVFKLFRCFTLFLHLSIVALLNSLCMDKLTLWFAHFGHDVHFLCKWAKETFLFLVLSAWTFQLCHF